MKHPDVYTSPEILSAHWQKGVLPCPRCGQLHRISQLQAMQFFTCPSCGNAFFIPGKIGEYFLLEPCGGGGMGSVYKSISTRYPGKMLAVKVLSRESSRDPANILALLNECRIGKKIGNSDFIVQFVDSGWDGHEYYSVMSFLSGERLDKRIQRCGHLSEQEVCRLAMHLLAAEQHIYRCGFLYRDMKPENVMINDRGYAILFDFGLCVSREQAAHPEDDYVSGSPNYLPPERLKGEGEDARSELYSLGMVLYHALTGQTFYDASEFESLAKRHLSRIRLSQETKFAGVSADMRLILGRMIEQAPAERPASFRDVFDAFKTLSENLDDLR